MEQKVIPLSQPLTTFGDFSEKISSDTAFSTKVESDMQPLKSIISSQPLNISSPEANIFSEKYKEGEDYKRHQKIYKI